MMNRYGVLPAYSSGVIGVPLALHLCLLLVRRLMQFCSKAASSSMSLSLGSLFQLGSKARFSQMCALRSQLERERNGKADIWGQTMYTASLETSVITVQPMS